MKKILAPLALLFIFAGCATKTISIEAPVEFAPELKGPPVPGSPEDVQDYQTLLQLQKSRSPAECTRGTSEVKINLENFYGPAYGPLSEAEVKKWADAFKGFSDLAWPLIGHAKEHWQRPRPFVAHADITPCAKLESSFSYPSGHAALARYFMHILDELAPEKDKELAVRADQLALDRNIVGVHYPSDVRDGKVLGDQLYDYLKNDPKFQTFLNQAKALH